MGVTINGNSITITDATIEVVNGANDESGVSYIIITPDGGTGALPFLAQGLPGQPTFFPSIQYLEVPFGTPLPVPNPAVTLLDEGGSGLPAKYALTFYGHAGDVGPPGSPSIANASDLAATPALGAGTDKFVLTYRSADALWVPTAQKVGDSYVSGTIAPTLSGNTSPRLLSSIAIPAHQFDYRLRVFAVTTVAGSDGATPTRVDLVARLNDAAAGNQLGFGKGLIGANAAAIQTVLLPTYLANESVPGGYARIAAGNGCTAHLRAEQVNPSGSNWSTPGSPITTFVAEVVPIP